MIQIDKSKYESIISDLIKTKDIKSLVAIYSKDRVYFYSILSDIGDGNSDNRDIVKEAANKFKLGESYIREQANSLVSYIHPKPPDMDYYKILGVNPDSRKEDIRKSWTKLMKDNHPDLVGEKGLETSRKINEAYSVLKDDKKKEEYDSKILPLLKVKVLGSRKGPTFGFKKVALVLLPALLFLVFYLLSLGGEKRTELASFQSSEINSKVEKVTKPAIDENSRMLKQIESIEPKKKKEVLPEKISSATENNKQLSEEKLISNKEIDKKVDKEISYEFGITKNEKKKVDKIENKVRSIPKEDIKINQKVISKSVVSLSELNLKKISDEKSETKVLGEKNKITIENDEVALLEKKIQKSDEIPKEVKIEPTSSSLFRFVSDYVTAYKARDVSRIKSLFLSDAFENGMPISKAIDVYSKNFNSNNILAYDVKVNKTEITNSKGFIDSDFNIVFRKVNNDEVKTSTGRIKWNLVWDQSNWKIKDINYNISSTKKMDKKL